MIKISKLFKIVLFVSSAIALGILLLSPMEIIGKYEERFFIVMAALGMNIIILAMTKDFRHYAEYRVAVHYTIPYLMSVFISIIYSKMQYGYSIMSMAKIVAPYLYILMAFPLIYVFIRDGNCFKFLKWVSLLEFGMLLIRFTSWFLYNHVNITIFPRLLFRYGEWVRDGFQRVESGGLYGVTLTVLAIYALKRKKAKRYFLFVVLTFLFLPVVTKARFQTAVAAGTGFVIYYFIEAELKYRKFIKNMIIISAGVILSFIGGIPEKIIALVSINGKYGSSTSVRLDGIKYFLTMLMDKRAVLGFGILGEADSYPQVYQLLLRNEGSMYYIDDMGIFGTIVQYGILSLVIYGGLFYLIIKICLKCHKQKNYVYLPLLMGLTVYLVVSSVFLSVFDVQRLYDLPFYIAIFSYVNVHMGDFRTEKVFKEYI